MTVDDRNDTNIQDGGERRKTPRVRPPGRLIASVIGSDIPVTVINLGLGGFRVQSSVEFTIGTSHDFRFLLSDRSTLDVGARVIYCLPRVAADGTVAYLTGFEFPEEPRRNNRAAAEEILQDLAFQLSVRVS